MRRAILLLLAFVATAAAYGVRPPTPPVAPRSPVDAARSRLGTQLGIAWRAAAVSTAAASPLLLPPRPSIAVDLPTECTDSLVVFRRGDRTIVMIGTAHISEDSVALVRRTIQQVKPDVVMIELDPKRVARAGVSTDDLLKVRQCVRAAAHRPAASSEN